MPRCRHGVLFLVLAAATPAQRAPCTGMVRTPTGVAIAAAEVTFWQESSQTFGLAPDRVAVKTDAAGAFTATLLLGSPYVAWAMGPPDTDGTRWITGVSMRAAAGKSLDLVAARRAGPHAVTLRNVAPWQAHVPPALRTLVGGHYPLDFDRPLRGDETMQLGPWPGYEVEFALVDDKRQVVCRIGPIGEDAGEVVFPPLRTIEVEAVDERGAPLENVEIGVHLDRWWQDYADCDPLPPMPPHGWRVAAWTDARGRARLPLAWDAEAGDASYTFAAATTGRAVSISRVERNDLRTFGGRPDAPLRFVLPKSSPRSLAVRDGQHGPRGWAALLQHSRYATGSGNGVASHLASAPLVDGAVRFAAANRVAQARCFVRLAASTAAPVRVCIAECPDDGDVAIDFRDLTLRTLLVRDPAGKPAPFAQIVVVHRFEHGMFEHDRCIADAEGRVELRSSAATWDIIAITDGGLGWSRIDPEDPRRMVPVDLWPIDQARFLVVDELGHPVADARLDDRLPVWHGRPEDHLLREVALHQAMAQRSDHRGRLVVPMPYGEFREVRIVRGSRKTWRQTVRVGATEIAVDLR